MSRERAMALAEPWGQGNNETLPILPASTDRAPQALQALRPANLGREVSTPPALEKRGALPILPAGTDRAPQAPLTEWVPGRGLEMLRKLPGTVPSLGIWTKSWEK